MSICSHMAIYRRSAPGHTNVHGSKCLAGNVFSLLPDILCINYDLISQIALQRSDLHRVYFLFADQHISGNYPHRHNLFFCILHLHLWRNSMEWARLWDFYCWLQFKRNLLWKSPSKWISGDWSNCLMYSPGCGRKEETSNWSRWCRLHDASKSNDTKGATTLLQTSW